MKMQSFCSRNKDEKLNDKNDLYNLQDVILLCEILKNCDEIMQLPLVKGFIHPPFPQYPQKS